MNDEKEVEQKATELVTHFNERRLLVKRGACLRAEDVAYLRSMIESALTSHGKAMFEKGFNEGFGQGDKLESRKALSVEEVAVWLEGKESFEGREYAKQLREIHKAMEERT